MIYLLLASAVSFALAYWQVMVQRQSQDDVSGEEERVSDTLDHTHVWKDIVRDGQKVGFECDCGTWNVQGQAHARRITVSDTPRTDANRFTAVPSRNTQMPEVCDADFARQLERELSVAEERLKQTAANAEGVIWELHKVESELAAMTKRAEARPELAQKLRRLHEILKPYSDYNELLDAADALD